MECPNCHVENREWARFCRACGARLAPTPIADQPVGAGPTPTLIKETVPAKSAAISDQVGGVAGEVELRIREAASLPPSAGPEPALAASPPPGAAAPVEPLAQVEAAALAGEGPSLGPAQEAGPGAQLAMAPPEATEAPTSPPGPQAQVAPVMPPAEVGLRPTLEPLPPGTSVARRFEIIELLEAKPDTNLYAARDLAMCPNCGATGNAPGEPFCGECGIELKSAGAPVICKLCEARSPEVFGVASEKALADNERFYVRLAEEPAATLATAAPVLPAAQRGLALAVGYASHVGMVRDLDEDSLCVFTLAGVYESVADPTLGLFIVADGMGGHEGGEVASKMTVQIVARELIRRLLLRRFLGDFQGQTDAVPKLVTGAIVDANKKMRELAQQRGNDMGCTITLALVMDGTAYIANVGDSRTYIHRQGKLRQITTDHSLVASLVTAGVLPPEEIFTHPDRSVIYRSIGAKATIEVDTFEEPLALGDTLLLCCDGLWEAIRDEGIEEVLLTYPDPQTACIEMVRQANLAGGEDNISVIVVKVHEVPASALVP